MRCHVLQMWFRVLDQGFMCVGPCINWATPSAAPASLCALRASQCQICYVTLLSPTPSPTDFLLPKEIRNLCEPWLSCDKGMDLSGLIFSTFRRIRHGHLGPQQGLDRIVHISWLSWGSRIWGVPKLPVPSVSSSPQPLPAHQG